MRVPILRAAVSAIAEQAQASDRDCCVFARAVLRHAYGAELVDQVPVARWHLYAEPGIGPWEPVLAAVDAGIAERVTAPTVGRWHICQGWRGVPLGQGVTGHTWLWLAVADGWGMAYDSTRQRGQRATGLVRWSEYASAFHGGLALAALHPTRRA